MSSSPPRGIIPTHEETSPFLNPSSIEDLGDLWPLLDDQENLVAQSGPSNTIVDGQAVVTDDMPCMFPHEHGSDQVPTLHNDMNGGQLLERQNTMLLAESSILRQELLFAETADDDDELMYREESAGCPARPPSNDHDNEKGNGKAHSSPKSRGTEERPSRRTRTGGEEPDKQQMDCEESSVVKKQDHNAKERVRRMKLNASYLALGELLPPSRRSKKRWSAPMIIDRVVEYIPELRQEIEDLTVKKERMLEHKAEAASCSSAVGAGCSDQLESSSPITVSVHNVRSGEELIVQICAKRKRRRREDPGEDDGIVSLLSNFEAEGISVLTASMLDVGEDQACYHLHIQMNGCSPYGNDYAAILKGKVISWLTGPPGS
ncbi:hypothetical protein SAY87_017814 [Trapa incisa]|uniref:BHLH domain-containing protein n=1 Tax=Trapa incisa TaxID=236973 RepID=A0AAN7L1D7_9MYRT|nr:hypothetical protein SAY87_017814 [Trapa incisa]